MSIVTLPKKNLKYLDDDIIEVDIPSDIIDKNKLSVVLENTKGMWKNKNIDPLQYQQNARQEWN
ncbi:MAG TPA: hypothetical protein PKY81_14905 [bacterium]|nr:hypothetical protein [bacterium]